MTTVTYGQTATGWTVDDSTFGARLALIRIRMDWNVKEAARSCEVPAASWRTWERDGVTPRRVVDIAKTISDVTGCDYLWLLTGSKTGHRISGVTERYRPPIIPRQVTGAHKRPTGRADEARRPPNRPADHSRPVLVRGSSIG
jgi:hypothetical protein